MKLFKLLLVIFYFKTNALTLSNMLIDRRSVVAGTVFSPQLANNYQQKTNPLIKQNEEIDYYAHWSIYGFVPPPIEKVVSTQELTDQINMNNIISLQIAVQHDTVIATTLQNHRWSCFIKDKDFYEFVEQFRQQDNSLPFTVIPLDKNKQKLRRGAQFILGTYIFRLFAYEIPKNIKLLRQCNQNMTFNQKMIYLLDNQNKTIV